MRLLFALLVPAALSAQQITTYRPFGTLRDQADLVLSFGAATWPHQLVRVMLGEQLYRAATILSGHPYHRS